MDLRNSHHFIISTIVKKSYLTPNRNNHTKQDTHKFPSRNPQFIASITTVAPRGTENSNSPETHLPIEDDNGLQLYRAMKTTGRFVDDYALFSVKVPFADKRKFDLFILGRTPVTMISLRNNQKVPSSFQMHKRVHASSQSENGTLSNTPCKTK